EERSSLAVAAFLKDPRVAVRVGEIGEARVVAALRIQPGAPSTGPRLERVLVPDLVDGDATGDQFRPLGREVGGHQVKLVHPARRVGSDQRDDLQGEHAQASFLVRKFLIAGAISLAWVSSAKWPVSRNRTSALRLSRLNASAPDGRKNGSFLPHTASSGGWC